MIRGLSVSIWAESLKARKSKMFYGTLIFFTFIGIMMGLLMFVARHPEISGRSQVMSAKVSVLGNGDLTAFINIMLQMALTIGTIGFGLVTAWIFGREYSEKVIKDIIALPVSRITIVLSKLFVAFTWCIVITCVLFLSGALTGIASGMPGWSIDIFMNGAKTYLICAILNMLLSTLVAFVASLGRGYLLSIAYVILTMIVTQLIFVGIPSLAKFLPWAFPALISGIAGEAAPMPTFISYLIFVTTILFGFAATAVCWRYRDQKQ
jgi:ABC-2 type transport system permease protein